jgi:hypothetical protein
MPIPGAQNPPGGVQRPSCLTGRLRRCKPRRCRLRAGPARPWPGRISWWCGGRRGMPLSRTSHSGTAASSAAVMNACRRVCGSDLLGQSGASRHAADDPSGSVPVQPLPGCGEEDRPFAEFADGQVDRPGGTRGERDDGFLTARAGNGLGPVTAFVAEGFDVGAGGLGHPTSCLARVEWSRPAKLLTWGAAAADRAATRLPQGPPRSPPATAAMSDRPARLTSCLRSLAGAVCAGCRCLPGRGSAAGHSGPGLAIGSMTTRLCRGHRTAWHS